MIDKNCVMPLEETANKKTNQTGGLEIELYTDRKLAHERDGIIVQWRKLNYSFWGNSLIFKRDMRLDLNLVISLMLYPVLYSSPNLHKKIHKA